MTLAFGVSESKRDDRMKVPFPLVWRAADDARWTWASPAWMRHTGQSQEESHDRGWLDAVHPDDHIATLAAWTTGQDAEVFTIAQRIFHVGEQRYRIFETHVTQAPDNQGGMEWLGASIDIGEPRLEHGYHTGMTDELRFRVRNLLSVVRSIARQTVGHSETIQDYFAHLEGRLACLARGQAFVLRDPDRGVDLENVVREEFLSQAAQDNQFTIHGREVRLSTQVAEILILAVHELATNATKFGALSVPEGHVDLKWNVTNREGKPWLDLEWLETGVPILAPAPRKRGFGSELIEKQMLYELGGRGSLDFRPGGVRCIITLPLIQDALPIVAYEENDADDRG